MSPEGLRSKRESRIHPFMSKELILEGLGKPKMWNWAHMMFHLSGLKKLMFKRLR